MEELLKTAMEDGEELLWSGRPEKFETLDKTYKPIFLRKLIISLLVGAVFSVGYILLARKSGVELKWGFFVVVWVFCSISPIGIFRDAKALAKTVYGITDKRLITVANTDAVRAVAYDKLEQAEFYTDEDGHTSLICGKAGGKKPGGNLRGAATSAVSADEEKCDRFVMYAVPQSDKIRKLLSEYMEVK